MGKRDKWSAGAYGGPYGGYEQQRGHQQDRSWNLWHGARGQWEKEQRAKDGSPFPAYDSVTDWQVPAIMPVQETRTGEGSEPTPTFTGQVQKAVNQARKQDVRVEKLQTELAAKERKWQIYSRQLQQAYVKQHAKHMNDLDRIRKELAEAQGAQQSAQQRIRDTIREAAEPDRQDPRAAQAMADWDLMTTQVPAPMELEEAELPKEEALRYAQRVMQQARETDLPNFGSRPPAAERPAPATPPQKHTGALPYTPPAVKAPSAYAPVTSKPARPEPYHPSPGNTAAAAAKAVHLGEGSHLDNPSPARNREPPPSGPGPGNPAEEVAAKLEQTRAMRPFGAPLQGGAARPPDIVDLADSEPDEALLARGDSRLIGLLSAVDILIAAAQAFPEPLPRPVPSALLMPTASADTLPAHEDAPSFWGNSGLDPLPMCPVEPVLMDAPELAAPAIEESSDESDHNTLQGTVLVMAPQYQAEILYVPLGFPVAMDHFLNTVREALVALNLRFSSVIIPAFPQLGPDFATTLLVPSWLNAAGMQVVIYDFRPLQGPVYAAYAWDRISYGDCVRESRRHNLHDWRVFVNGHTRPLAEGESFLAVPGGVLQFRPYQEEAVWYCPLHARFDRPNMWSSDPLLPVPSNELPIMVLFHDQSVLYSPRRFPGIPTVTCITDLVERTPDTAILVAPRGNLLADIDHYGIRCRDALAVYPLTPGPRECIIVFLDPRQANYPLRHILLPSPDVDPDTLIQRVGLRAPPGCRIVHYPRADDQGLLRLSEGDVVTFGFAQTAQWECSGEEDEGEEDDSNDDGDSSEPDSDGHGLPAPPDVSLLSPAGHNALSASGEASQNPSTNRSRSRSRSRPGSTGASSKVQACKWLSKVGISANTASFGYCVWEATVESVAVLAAPLSDAFLPALCVFAPPWHSSGKQVSRWSTTSIDGCAPFGVLQTKGRMRQAKILEEPTPTTRAELEALDHLVYFAGQFGLPWRYWPAWRIQERLELMPPIPVWDEVVEVLVTVAVAVAVPGYELERFSVEVLLPCHADVFLGAVQAARRPFPARHFPILVPALPQPTRGWALFAAFPAWDPQAMVVLVDSRAYDGRLFALQVPGWADHYAVLRLAGLPPHAPVGVHTALDVGVLLAGIDTRLFPGQCLRIVPEGMHPPPALPLSSMVASSQDWTLGPAFPLPVHGSCYCCVTDNGHHLFVPDPDRPWRYRRDLADSCAICVDSMVVCPAVPSVADCTVFGHLCRTALAVGLRTRSSTFVLVDCRPIMEGWTLWPADNPVEVEEIIEQIGNFAPLFWSLALLVDRGPPLTNGRLRVRPGQVLTAVYLQEGAEVAPSTHSSSDSDHSDDEGKDTEDSDEVDPGGARFFLEPGWAGDPIPSSSVVESSSRGGALSAGAALHNSLSGPCRLVCAPLLRLLLIQYLFCVAATTPTPVGSADASVGFLQGDMWCNVISEDAHSGGQRCFTPVLSCAEAHKSTCSVDPPLQRPLPTPARARPPTPGGLEVSIGPTLLELAVQADGGYAFYVASTLLETLQEHFFPGLDVCSTGLTVSLADCVPVSDFQRQCLQLEKILEFDAHGPDWLDNDLQPLLEDRQVPLQWRTVFVNIRRWHDCNSPEPLGLHVFTDGSAASQPGDLRPCSWAFTVWVDTHVGRLLWGFASATSAIPASPYFLGEVEDTALVGEQLALAWGLAWVIEYARHFEVPVTIQRPPQRSILPYPDFPPLSAVLVHLRHLASQSVSLVHAYVAGHSGCVENELADQLAKQSRRRPCEYWERISPLWPSQLVRHSLLPWAWMLHSRSPDLPPLFALQSEAARMQSADIRPCQAPAPGVLYDSHPTCVAEIHFVAVSYNALTLRDPKGQGDAAASAAGLRITGRKAILKQQFAQVRPLFVGLQETRVPDTSVQPDADYIILQSASTVQGSLGVALWVAKAVSYCCTGGVPQHIQARHCTVFGTSPRHLAVDIEAPHLRLVVLVLHAPTLATATRDDVIDFWRARTKEIEKRPQGADFLLLCDSNSRVGSTTIGDHGSEPENEAGTLFREFLEGIEGFLPSTFVEHHPGSSATWISPFDTCHRLDYIVTPIAWASFKLSSWVWVEFESLQKKEDHWPVVLSCAFAKSAPRHWTARVQRKAARPPRPQTEAKIAQAVDVLQAHSPVPWHIDVDEHYDQLAAFWADAGAQLEPRTEHQPVQPFLSQDTLRLVKVRQALRAYLRDERAERHRRLLMFGFAAFCLHHRGDTFQPHHYSVLQRWFHDLDHSEAEALFRLMHLGFYLRKFVAADRGRYLAQLAADVQGRDLRNPAALYASVRKAFPAARSGKRSSYQPLPAISDSSGQLAVTTEERSEIWRQHFGQQEAGEQVSAAQYVEAFRKYKKPAGQPVFNLALLPNLAEVESLILGLKRGRAPGPDSVTVETLQVHASTTARQLLPVLLKTGLGLREPLTWRGGDLICLAKRAAATFSCRDYRSILVSSIPGKIHHRKLRKHLVELLSGCRPSLQAGAMPGEGVEIITIAAKTFQLLCDGTKRPWALAFFDLQAAFYQVVREALVPGCEDDAALLRLFDKMKLPPQAIVELKRHLQQLALLPRLSAPEHLTALVNDLFRGSWFRISGSALLTVTKRGTRPGDPAADVLFSLTLSAFLKSIATDLEAAQLLPEFPTPASRHDWASHSIDENIGSPAWADDFLQPQTGRDAVDLLARVQASVSLVTTKATSMGMTVSFGREKTAVLLPAWIPLLSDGISRAADDAPAYLPIHDPLADVTHRLLVVQAYKHLGGILVATSSPLPDLYHRAARANAVVKPLHRRLFSDAAVPLDTRRALLRSLAVSRFVHTSAAIFLHTAYHRRVWAQQFVALWRSLFRRRPETHTEHSFTVLRVARAPSPPLALAQSRASFLAKLTGAGPGLLARLLFDHWAICPSNSWLEQLKGDVNQVCLYLPHVRAILPSGGEVVAILDSMLEDPTWWPAQVRKAQAVFGRDLEIWNRRRRAGHLASAPAQQEPRPFTCGFCPATFVLRKHLCVHLSRTHGVLAPARKFGKLKRRKSRSVVLPILFQKRISRVCRMAQRTGRAALLARTLRSAKRSAASQDARPRCRACKAGSWEAAVSAAAIKAAGQGGRWSSALAQLAEMELQQLQASLPHFGAAMSACAAGRQWQRVLELLWRMPERQLSPDVACFGVAAGACERAGHHVLSSSLLAEMCQAPGQNPKTLTIGFTNAMTEAFRGSRWDRALQHFSDAVEMRLVLDITAYGAALAACQKGAAWLESLEILRKLNKAETLPANASGLLVACSAALGACAHGAHWEHALEHLAFAQRLASLSQEVSQPFLVALHGAVSVFAEARRWEQALELLPQMQQEFAGHSGIPLTTFRAANAAAAACGRSLAWRKACLLLSFDTDLDRLGPSDLASFNASKSIGLFLASTACERSQVAQRSLSWMDRSSKSWHAAKAAGSGIPSLAADLAPVATALLNTASLCKDSIARFFGRGTFQPLLRCLDDMTRHATGWNSQSRVGELGLDGLTDVGLLYGRLVHALSTCNVLRAFLPA
ncbi:unnamed protein product [Symbiodinium microadriaticum]|nr:unnamed protein product [Symbiodinium microadriaticum]